MAEKDDDFMEGDDGAAADKDGGKPKGRFAPAFLLQILKWVAIVLGGIIFVVTVVIITVSAMGAGQQKGDRVEESPEYRTVVPVLGWFDGIGELRGVTNDDPKRTFVMHLQLGYTKDDQNLEAELGSKKVQLTDFLLTWFSSQNGDYLNNINNRDQIRETIRAEINHMLEKPVREVRFVAFQILDF